MHDGVWFIFRVTSATALKIIEDYLRLLSGTAKSLLSFFFFFLVWKCLFLTSHMCLQNDIALVSWHYWSHDITFWHYFLHYHVWHHIFVSLKTAIKCLWSECIHSMVTVVPYTWTLWLLPLQYPAPIQEVTVSAAPWTHTRGHCQRCPLDPHKGSLSALPPGPTQGVTVSAAPWTHTRGHCQRCPLDPTTSLLNLHC